MTFKLLTILGPNLYSSKPECFPSRNRPLFDLKHCKVMYSAVHYIARKKSTTCYRHVFCIAMVLQHWSRFSSKKSPSPIHFLPIGSFVSLYLAELPNALISNVIDSLQHGITLSPRAERQSSWVVCFFSPFLFLETSQTRLKFLHVLLEFPSCSWMISVCLSSKVQPALFFFSECMFDLCCVSENIGPAEAS